MRNTIIVAILLFAAVVIASIFYFGDLNKEKQESVRPIGHLPQDTYLITSFINDATTDNIFKDFEIFEAIIGKSKQSSLSYLKQNILRNRNISPYLAGSEIFISFHPEKSGLNTLISIPSNEKIESNELAELLSNLTQKYHLDSQDTASVKIFSFTQLKSDSTDTILEDSVFHVMYKSNIFFASYSKEILFKIADKNTKKLQEDQIEFFNKHNKKNTPFTVYLPHQNIPSIVSEFKRNKAGDFLKQFTDLKGQTAWNINFKQDALILSGESELSESKAHYISLFANQSKTNQRLYNYYPSNTMMFIEYSFSDKKKWYQDLSQWQSTKVDNEQFQKLKEQINTDRKGLFEEIKSAFGENFAVIEQNNSNYLGFINISDSANFNKIIHAIAETSADSIYRFRYNNIPSLYFGEGMKAFSRPYFIQIDDLIVLANHQSTIQTYLKDWKSRNLLIGTAGFKNYEQIQGNEANVTFFINTKNANNFLNNSIQREYRKNFSNKEEYGYQDFYSWSLQLSGNSGNFISRLYAIYKSKNRLGVTPDWTYNMNSRLINGPYVFEQSDTSQMVLVQEQDHTLHAIHPSGAKLWNALLSGRIVGKIQQLNDRSLILVTDRRRLYRFDTGGKTLKGFSTSISNEPTATPSVGTWKTHEIIFVPSKNKILAYDMEGGPQMGWDDIQVEGEILGPIQIVESQIIVSTDSGKIYFFDFQGNKTNEIDVPAEGKLAGTLGIIKQENESIFYCTDDTGKVYQIKENGSSKVVFEGKWNKKYTSNYSNVHGNIYPELIIADDSNLQVYQLGDSLNLIYDYTFTHDISDEPYFFKIGSDKNQMGIATKGTNLIYLFKENGSLVDGFPVESLPLFYYGKINYNSGNYLITSKRDFKLYSYPH